MESLLGQAEAFSVPSRELFLICQLKIVPTHLACLLETNRKSYYIIIMLSNQHNLTRKWMINQSFNQKWMNKKLPSGNWNVKMKFDDLSINFSMFYLKFVLAVFGT